MSESRYRVPVDPHYKLLVNAINRKAGEIAKDTGGKILSLRIVRAVSNVVGAILSLDSHETIETIWILYGVSTTHPAMRGHEDVAKAGVGISVEAIPFNPALLPVLQHVVEAQELLTRYCECGHSYDKRRVRHSQLGMESPSAVCPACGYSDSDPEVWKPIDKENP